MISIRVNVYVVETHQPAYVRTYEGEIVEGDVLADGAPGECFPREGQVRNIADLAEFALREVREECAEDPVIGVVSDPLLFRSEAEVSVEFMRTLRPLYDSELKDFSQALYELMKR